MTTKNIEEDICINRDDLRDYIHQIHDDLRNAGAGYGQTGLKIFSVFYGLKLIKPNLKKLKIKDEYKEVLDWDKLVERAKNKEKEIIEYIDNEVLQALFELKNDCKKNDEKKTGIRDSEVGHFIFHQIPTDISDDIYKNLILKIDKIPVGFKGNNKVNLSGKLWEYFVGRDKTAISELGAYFTDRPVTNYIFERLKPSLDDDNNVRTMIDPYGGSGGFTLGYANYFRSNYDNINWKNNVDNIYHFDMEETVVKMTGLEMFAITGYFPKRYGKCNFTRGNTFQEEFNNSKYHYVISNPPYGGDKNKKNAQDIKRDKLIAHLKSMKNLSEAKKNQLSRLLKEKKDLEKKKKAEQTVNKSTCSKRINAFCKTHKIDVANDKEACSLILLMDLLEKDGTCVGVLKEGVFFDGKYSKVREVLLNNYNVTDIISIPANAFENTTTKTSIIIFHNNGPTKKIKFSQLIIHKVKEDVFGEAKNGEEILKKVKDDFDKIEEKSFSEATIKQIKDLKTKNRCIYSLNAKDYKDYKVTCPDGFELKKLGDICEFTGHKINTDNENGKFNFYTCSEKIGKCNEPKINGEHIILGSRGTIEKAIHFMNGKFGCGNNMLLINSINKNSYENKYIYFLLKKYTKYIKNKTNGSVVQMLSQAQLLDIDIPFPKDIAKLKPQLDKIYKLHQQIAQNTESIPEKEKAICEIIKSAIDGGKKGVDYEEYKLGDVCEVNPNNKKILNEYIEYLDIAGCKEFITEKIKNDSHIPSRAKRTPMVNDILISSVRPENKNINFVLKHNYKENLVASTGFIIIRSDKYKHIIYYNIVTEDFTKKLINICSGSNYPSFTGGDIKNIIIKIPTEKQMKKLKLQELFDEVDELKETLEKNKDQYQNMMKEMFKDFEDEESEDEQVEDIINETENEDSEYSDDEPEYETIEHKGKEYYLDGKKIYRINKDKSIGEYYGKYIDGEVIKKTDKKIKIKTKTTDKESKK
jgi:restriction endonuclease S subunit